MAQPGHITPSFDRATGWINSAPLTLAGLHGEVVLVDFWTYTCINSQRNIPYIRAWAEKYRKAGLVVIGAHTPEFSFERLTANVEMARRKYDIPYPIAIDSRYGIWQSFNNAYWPADYVLDGKGHVRYSHFGEGDYAQTEHAIQKQLRDNGATDVPTGLVADTATGVEAPPDFANERSTETYTGTDQGEGFVSPLPAQLALNHWGVEGSWTRGTESVRLDAAPGRISYRFHSRDLHLIVAPPANGGQVHFRVTIDGAPPGADHGADIDESGAGVMVEPRLYQLVRQRGPIRDRTFTIEFAQPGVEVYDFSFG